MAKTVCDEILALHAADFVLNSGLERAVSFSERIACRAKIRRRLENIAGMRRSAPAKRITLSNACAPNYYIGMIFTELNVLIASDTLALNDDGTLYDQIDVRVAQRREAREFMSIRLRHAPGSDALEKVLGLIEKVTAFTRRLIQARQTTHQGHLAPARSARSRAIHLVERSRMIAGARNRRLFAVDQ